MLVGIDRAWAEPISPRDQIQPIAASGEHGYRSHAHAGAIFRKRKAHFYDELSLTGETHVAAFSILLIPFERR